MSKRNNEELLKWVKEYYKNYKPLEDIDELDTFGL